MISRAGGCRRGALSGPVGEDRCEIDCRCDETDMTMSVKNTHDRAGNAGGHVASLRDGWHEMILFGREKQGRTADLVQSMPNVKLPEQSEAADVAGFRRLPCQREKALHVIAMGML